ncbi:Heterokaryon incompatibility 6 OR allele protein [Rutstroemia sp. NJR-2017a BBW]|nr:Heterokaryon incompatibility 6 OR allele protein [Rutstroemia sp. NJR-2017a BBW]
MDIYQTPLDSRKKEIRILILEPSSTGHPIKCSTKVVSLLSEPQYEALSYVWGDVSIRGIIVLDGCPFLVTKNLALALHHLRLPDKPRRLWVDAVCINQNDVKERNEQVAMMGEVYVHAKPVVIFLGEAYEDSDEVLGFISTVSEEAEITEETSVRFFSLYTSLVEKEWFTRLWTVQELVLATQDPLIGCGFAWTTWSKLLKLWQKVALKEFSKMGMVIMDTEKRSADNQGELLGVRPNCLKFDLLNNLRTSVGNSRGEELKDLLLNTVLANATEPKDRIYGLLGMMHNEDRLFFTVDYGRTLGVVYAEAIAHIFRKGTGPYLLSGMELAGKSLPDSSLPSWIPAFGSKTLLSPTRYHPPGVGVSGAGSGANNGIVDPDLRTLRVRGMPIDIVCEKERFGEGKEFLAQLPRIEALVTKAHELAKTKSEHRPYLNNFKNIEPLWRTLITNKAYSGAGREIAPEIYEEILALLNHLPGGCFFITETGFYGISEDTTEVGDHLAIWFGAPAPFVLKPIPQSSMVTGEPAYSVRGVAYVAGIMDGENC